VVIVGLGDSTTAGTPAFRSPLEAPPHGEGNPESQYAYWMMRANPEWTVLNRGINGQTAAQIRARFDRDVRQARPSYAIILAGVNDIFSGSEAESVERELAAMYADALDAAIVPVAASVFAADRGARGPVACPWIRGRPRGRSPPALWSPATPGPPCRDSRNPRILPGGRVGPGGPLADSRVFPGPRPRRLSRP